MPATDRRPSTDRILVLAVLAAGLLTGCSSLPKDTPTNSSESRTAHFTAQTIADQTVKIPSDKPAVLLFFSVECGGCGPTARALAKVQARDPRAADYAVVDIAPHETSTDIEAFLKSNGADSLSYTGDTDGKLLRAYQVTQLTTVLIVDAKGRVAYRAVEPTAGKIHAELTKVAAR